MENKVTFYPKNCLVSSFDEDKVIFSGERVDNVYFIDLNKLITNILNSWCLFPMTHEHGIEG